MAKQVPTWSGRSGKRIPNRYGFQRFMTEDFMHFFNPLFRNEDESMGDYNRIWDFRAPKIDFLSLMGYNHVIGSTAFSLTRWMSTRKWHFFFTLHWPCWSLIPSPQNGQIRNTVDHPCRRSLCQFQETNYEDRVREFDKLQHIGTVSNYQDKNEGLIALMLERNCHLFGDYFVSSF